MKFFALLKNELRQCLPWLLLAAVAFFIFGSLSIRAQRWHYQKQMPFENMTLGDDLALMQTFGNNPFSFAEPQILDEAAHIMLAVAIILGTLLATLQFSAHNLRKTWMFSLHRSVPRIEILTAKITAATISLTLSLGLVWTLFFWYASSPGVMPIPPRGFHYVIGWIFILSALLPYLGVALACLSTKQRFVAQLSSTSLITFIVIIVLQQSRMEWCIGILILSIAWLGVQLTDTFLKREF